MYANEPCTVSIVNSTQLHSDEIWCWSELYLRRTCRIYVFGTASTSMNDLEKRNRKKNKLVITGDFNPKHHYWSENKTDEKGVTMLDWTYALDLNILNDRKKPTLINHNGISYVDVTIGCNKTKQPEWRPPIYTIENAE